MTCWQGRLIDHVRNTQSVGLEDIQTLILDEADRLLDMGFADEVMCLPKFWFSAWNALSLPSCAIGTSQVIRVGLKSIYLLALLL